MASFKFNIEKAKAAILFITQEIGHSDMLKIFKILYFAEQKHLAKYGSLILADRYIAMKNGPVPSNIYDYFKGLRDGNFRFPNAEIFYKAFEVYDYHMIKGLEAPDMDCLSKSDVICIQDSIRENRVLDFNQLSEKSHDSAWAKADKDNEIDYFDIAMAGGANEEMMKYINECFEYSNVTIA